MLKVTVVTRTEGSGLSAGDERLGAGAGTRRTCQQSGHGVDAGERYSGGRLKASALSARDSGLHEARPDGQGGLRSGESQGAVVVIADPNDRQNVGRESHETTIPPILS